MDNATNQRTAPSACTSPGADAGPSQATPAAGVQTGRVVIWQRRNHHVTQIGCDRCRRAVSHFRAKFSEFGMAEWLCVDCAESAGVDIYQPARPIAQPTPAVVRDIDDSPVHDALEDRAEQAARHIRNDVRTYGWSYAEGVSW